MYIHTHGDGGGGGGGDWVGVYDSISKGAPGISRKKTPRKRERRCYGAAICLPLWIVDGKEQFIFWSLVTER